MNKKEKDHLYYLVHKERIKGEAKDYYWGHREEINQNNEWGKRESNNECHRDSKFAEEE